MIRNSTVPTPENSSVVAGGKPVSTGTRKVAPNIATTCWAPMPMVRAQLSRSWGATTKSSSGRASTLFHVRRVTVHILLRDAGSGGFVLADGRDLRRRRGRRVEPVSEPLPDQAPGQFDTDDPLAEAQHLGVVGQDRPFDGEAVVRGDRPDPGHLVGADRHA